MSSQQSRLLIVDDNEMNRDMLARRLERNGYLVDVVESVKNGTHWRRAVPMMVFGIGIFRPAMCTTHLAGKPCWAGTKTKSATLRKNGSTGFMTQIAKE